MTTTIDCHLFDGRSAAAAPVQAQILGAELLVRAGDGSWLRRAALRDVALSEPFARAPRMVGFADGATLEVTDGAAFSAALGGADPGRGRVARLQRAWPAALAAAALACGLSVTAYRLALPMAARRIAFSMSPAAEQRMGEQVLAYFGGWAFRESRLPAARREAIARAFARMATTAAPGVHYRLIFRRGTPPLDTNAFSLPGGTIVLLDGLVARLGRQDQVLAVLAHELGHVANKHVPRRLMEAAGLGAMATLAWGDFSVAAAGVPAALGTLKHSRDFEREADAFAVQFLRDNRRSAKPLYEAFLAFQQMERERGHGWPAFLSTHPSTAERLERLSEER